MPLAKRFAARTPLQKMKVIEQQPKLSGIYSRVYAGFVKTHKRLPKLEEAEKIVQRIFDLGKRKGIIG